MRAVLQRVESASVAIGGDITASIGRGFLVLLGITQEDTIADAEYLADKCAGLRIFSDEQDKMNLSLSDVGGGILVVSNFTLYGDCRKGRRPSLAAAARPEQAVPLYEAFVAYIREHGFPDVQTGCFGADMKITLVNDGPVTMIMDTETMKRS